MHNKSTFYRVFAQANKARLNILFYRNFSFCIVLTCILTLSLSYYAIAAPTPYEFNVTQLGDTIVEQDKSTSEKEPITEKTKTNNNELSQEFPDSTSLEYQESFSGKFSESFSGNFSETLSNNTSGHYSGDFSFSNYAKENFNLSNLAGDFMLALNGASENDGHSMHDPDISNYVAQNTQDENVPDTELKDTELKDTELKDETFSSEKPPHILVVAGIQGDEPGGFSAASLLATRYSISYGTVTIVPNLNFLAIINRKRGVYGDMNRKFAALDKDDPEYEIVQRIKEMIVTPSIDLILNLHDGSGFYNPKHISDLQNPNRWGNSIIIDQDDFDAPRFGELRDIASAVAEGVNTNLLKDLHAIHVHNTKTAEGNEEMAKSLTWFALGKGKPAFGVEASKNLNVAERTFYHLSMLENFFDYVGIKYHRPFELSPAGIQKALSTDIFIGFEQNRLVLPLNNIRRNQAGSIPLSKESRCLSNSPIITAVTNKNEITVHYGNNYLTSFKIDWHEVDTSIDRMFVEIDGTKAEVPFGTVVFAQDYFLVEPQSGYRVNAIGAVVGNGPRGDEAGKKIHLKDFQDRFSIDKSGTTYRVEVYSGSKYVGTFVVQYAQNTGETVTAPLGQ